MTGKQSVDRGEPVDDNDDDNDHTNAPSASAIGGTPNWVDPVHDAAGNMTKCPKPKVANEAADEASRLHLVYDAWNRLTKVYDPRGGLRRKGRR